MVIKKEDFIPKFLKLIERKLNEELPKEDFEGEMINQSYEILNEYCLHMKGVIGRGN